MKDQKYKLDLVVRGKIIDEDYINSFTSDSESTEGSTVETLEIMEFDKDGKLLFEWVEMM